MAVTDFSRADSDLASAIRANAPILAVVAIYVALALVLSRIVGFELNVGLYNRVLWAAALLVGIATISVCSIYTLARNRPQRPIGFLLRKLAGDWRGPRRSLYGLPILIVLPIFGTCFTSLKSSIKAVTPFYADPWFSDLDRIIHGGDAWRLIQPLVGYPLATKALDVTYLFWFAIFFSAAVLAAFMVNNDRLRLQFFLSLLLMWALLGNVMATAFASVGPCYYAVFHGEDRYADLMSYLRSTNEIYSITALKAHDFLLALYSGSEVGLGDGISAMPSLHVGISALVAIFAWRVNRMLGLAAAAFTLVTLVASVHLGWHYAVDGYVSLLCVPLVWMLAGVPSRRYYATGDTASA